MILAPGDEATARDGWHIRVRHYVGIGSSLSGDRPLVLAPGETVTRRIVAVVVDGIVSPVRAAELAELVRAPG
jgi:hypothetical protein